MLQSSPFSTLPMQFRTTADYKGMPPFMDRLQWHLVTTFGAGNYSFEFQVPIARLIIPAQEEGVNPFVFAQLILWLDYYRDPDNPLFMRYPDGEFRLVKHYQVMRRYLFHHWDRPHLAGKTPRSFWGLHIGKNALPSYPWDDPYIAFEAGQRSKKLMAAARGGTSMQELLS